MADEMRITDEVNWVKYSRILNLRNELYTGRSLDYRLEMDAEMDAEM
jgi:hypothetical protein